MDNRARITVPFVARLVFAVAVLGALFPVFMDGFDSQLSTMATGTALLLRLLLPFAVLVLLGIIYRKGVAGRGR